MLVARAHLDAHRRRDDDRVHGADLHGDFLKESIAAAFYPIVLLDAVGLVCITQPRFLFEVVAVELLDSDGPSDGDGYALGAGCALLSAAVSGLLPVCTRLSRRCFWTAVNHVSDALSAFVLTPCAFAVWFAADPTAWGQLRGSLAPLVWHEQGGGAEGPQLGTWACLLGATLTGFAGLALQTLGYQRTQAAAAGVMTND